MLQCLESMSLRERTAARQPQQISEAPIAASGELGQIQEQLTALQAQQAEVAAPGETGAMIAQLQQLGQLHESGILTEAEFAAAKAKLLAGQNVSGAFRGF